jgi:hypothetical protein
LHSSETLVLEAKKDEREIENATNMVTKGSNKQNQQRPQHIETGASHLPGGEERRK